MADGSGVGMTYSTMLGAMGVLARAGTAAEEALFAVRRAFPAADGCGPATVSACIAMLDTLEAATAGLAGGCSRLHATLAGAVKRFEVADSLPSR